MRPPRDRAKLRARCIGLFGQRGRDAPGLLDDPTQGSTRTLSLALKAPLGNCLAGLLLLPCHGGGS